MASAPGKLFLFGEYAVLAKGVCLVTATDRRVTAHAHAEASPDGYQVLGAPDLSADTRLIAQVCREIGATPSHFSSDVRALYHQGVKLGLGSSAASTVAALATKLEGDALFEAAFRAHRRLQRGRGSCADVAASVYGGTLAYQLTEPQAPFQSIGPPMDDARAGLSARLRPFSWPDGARVEAIWTGRPASSSELIGRVEVAWADRPELVRGALLEIDRVARAAASLSHDADALVSIVQEGEEAMRRLGAATGAPIVTPLHETLSAHATIHGARAKPSGAGGGDFSLLVGSRDLDWAALLATLPHGCHALDISIGARGAENHG